MHHAYMKKKKNKKKKCMTFSKDSVNLKHLMHHFENVVNSEGFSLPLVTKLPNLCEIL